MPPTPPKKQDLAQALEKKMSQITSREKAQGSQELAQKLHLPFSDLVGLPIDPQALTLVDEATARASQLAVINRSGATLFVAVADPENEKTKETLSFLRSQKFTLTLVVTSAAALEKAFERYSTLKKQEVFEVGAIDIKEENLEKLQAQISSLDDLKTKLSGIAATELLEILIAGALKIRASDIHFEPEKDSMRLRYRLDGLLQDVTNLDLSLYNKALNRIKVLAKLKLNIHRAPQDGRFTIRLKDIAIEVRVSILPSEYGESIVMRLLDPRGIQSKLEDLGMREDVLALVREQLDRPQGALFTTGPTGSGKTTSLYAFINALNTPDTKIITVEDPIEYHVKGVSQTQVDPAKGYTFASGLRAIVRQDPDVILIGEIRDLETAGIALNAALTGHLVLSTIHTNDAAGTIPRLVDIGAKPEIIAPALSMAMGQRLLRRLCPKCKKTGTIAPEDLSKVQSAMEPILARFKLSPINDQTAVYTPVGCVECNNLGYKGRIGVYEVFVITKEMERLILKNPSISDVRDLAVSQGMITMLQDGYLKLLNGTTSLEEIRRILG